MEIFSTLLALCVGNSPVTSEFPAQRPVTRSFHVFFDPCQNKRYSKQWWGWWFEMPSCPLWHCCNVLKYYPLGFFSNSIHVLWLFQVMAWCHQAALHAITSAVWMEILLLIMLLFSLPGKECEKRSEKRTKHRLLRPPTWMKRNASIILGKLVNLTKHMSTRFICQYILCHLLGVCWSYQVKILDFSATTCSPCREFGIEHTEQRPTLSLYL